MAGVVWVRWVFVAVFVAVALLCVVRLLAHRRDAARSGCGTDRISDASHGVMGLGMAAMFSPWGAPVPALYWQVLFGALAGVFAVRMIRRGTRPAAIRQPGTDLHHVIGSLAMVYMLGAIPAGHSMAADMSMPGMASTGIALPVLAWVLVAYFLVYAVRLGARLVEPASPVAATSAGAVAVGGGPRGVVTSPHLLGSCLIFMGIGMSYMLVTML